MTTTTTTKDPHDPFAVTPTTSRQWRTLGAKPKSSMRRGLVATPIEFMATHTPTNNDNLNEWRLGKRIAEALSLKPVGENKYRTEWGDKSPIGLTKALRAILKN